MFSRIRRRITYTNVAMTLVLVFAMSGGAWAASRYAITSTKQISPKVLKSLRGAKGQNGAAGQAGPAGPQGPAGAKGETGPAGAKGEPGSAGAPGTNGKEGEKGAPGSPWTAGGTLPSGKSETGTWSILYEATAAGQPGSSAISFTIPLAAEPEAHYIGTNEELAEEKNEAASIKEGKCKGTPEAPEAASGNLCVFAKAETNAKEYLFLKAIPEHFLGTGSDGTATVAAAVAAGEVLALGTWAVTG